MANSISISANIKHRGRSKSPDLFSKNSAGTMPQPEYDMSGPKVNVVHDEIATQLVERNVF